MKEKTKRHARKNNHVSSGQSAMGDERKTKAELLVELTELRRRLRDLENVESDHKRAENALRASEEMFRIVFDNLPIALEIYDKDGIIRKCNKKVDEFFGMDSSAQIGVFNIRNDPNYQYANVWETLERGEAVQHEAVFDFSKAPFPASRTGKKHCYVMVAPIPDEVSTDIGYIMQIVDITELKQAEDALRANNQIFDQTVKSIPVGVYRMAADANGVTRMEYASERFGELLGLKAEDILQDIQSIYRAVHPDDYESLTDVSIEAIQQSKNYKWEGRFPVGNEIRFVRAEAYPVFNEDGSSIWYGALSDITERKQVEMKLTEVNKDLEEQLGQIKILKNYLREQAIRDPVTDLYNRRYLHETMERELARAKRENYPVSVMMIDIDHFKAFNDEHGHQAGDEVLIALGSLLRASIRQGDIACRYGGEEFLIIMLGLNDDDAERRAEAIRGDFDNLAINYGGAQLHASISIGVAFYPQHGRNMNEIVKTADAALYKAKRAGRNLVHIWRKE